MRSFDLKTWRDRAIRRHKRLKNATPEHLHDELVSITKLKSVIDWCDSRSINVVFGKCYGAEYDPNENRILINNNTRPLKQAYLLLHEIGHYLIRECGTSRVRCSKNYQTIDSSECKTFHQKMDTIEEEYEAWDRGRRLAKRLKLKIDIDDYERFKAINMKTYFMWIMH